MVLRKLNAEPRRTSGGPFGEGRRNVNATSEQGVVLCFPSAGRPSPNATSSPAGSTACRARPIARHRPARGNRASVWLNSAGSSMFTVWPLFGNIARPEVAMCFFSQTLGSMQGSSSSPQMISVGTRDLLHVGLEVVDRRPVDLIAAQRVGGALGVVARELVVEFLEAARVLHLERNARRAHAVGFRDARRSRACRIPSRSLRRRRGTPPGRPRSEPDAGAGERQRERALRILDADAERRVAAHRQPDDVRLVDLQVIQHRDHVVAEFLVTVRRRASAARRTACSRAPNR